MEGYEYKAVAKNERSVKPIIKDSENKGITIRAMQELFVQVENLRKLDKIVNVSCSFLQIYNERVFDLLNAQSLAKGTGHGTGLRIRWNKTDQFTVENLFLFQASSADDAIGYFNQGIRNKVVASHNLNHASSRSHCMFTLAVEIID